MNKEIKRIFIVLACYALAGGVFYNFQELWMAENDLSTQTMGIVFSLCALLSVSTIFICSNILRKEYLKKFTCILLLVKSVILFLLFILHTSGLNILIKFLIMLDYVIDVELWASIYPMIALITKKNKIYALKDLIYSYAYYGGIIFTSIFLGKTILSININFNSYCLIGSICILIAFFVMKNTNLEKYYKNKKEENINNQSLLKKVVSIIKTDKITQNYILYLLFGEISYACINAFLITLLTTNFSFSASSASTFRMILGVLSVFIATIILEKLTSKNDYINFGIKFIGRFILYLLAVIFNNNIIFIIAIIYTRLLSDSYSHVTDAPYVNRFSIDNQLAFGNLREMIKYFSKAIGNLLCSMALIMGTRFNFLYALIFITVQIIFGFKAIKLRTNEIGEVNL